MSETLFEPPQADPAPDPNPCVAAFGKGPDGATCGTCTNLICNQWGKRYYKCMKRRRSACAATDHRVSWNACGCYAPDLSPTEEVDSPA